MTHEIAEVALWCAGVALVGAIAVAVHCARLAARLRIRVAGLEQDRDARDTALEQLVAEALPAVAASIGDPAPSRAGSAAVRSLAGTRFAKNLKAVSERYAADLGQARTDAEAASRERLVKEAQETTQAAVRSFAATVVSLGADLSKVVAEGLRQHRGDDAFVTLTSIDHTVQQMIRQAQSYVVVCGGLPGRRWPAQPLTDVVRGAMGRIQDYRRVKHRDLDRAVISRAVEPVVHTLATLLDNAARYSPPTSYVDVTFQEGHHGITIVVDDAGVRINDEQLEQVRHTISGRRQLDLHQLGPHPKIGFPTVAALAQRYGFKVSIDGSSPYGGMRATLFLPEALLTTVDPEQGRLSQPAPAEERQAPSETDGGLPKRRRRAAAEPVVEQPALSSAPARASIAADWRRGTRSGRAATSPSQSAEGSR